MTVWKQKNLLSNDFSLTVVFTLAVRERSEGNLMPDLKKGFII